MMATFTGDLRPRPGTAASRPPFVERIAELDLEFVHFNGMYGELHFTEIFGSGGAVFDYDNDGWLDLLINEVGRRNAWLGLRLTDATGRIDLTGTRVEIVHSDGNSLWRRARVAASHCSSNDSRVLIGLGADPAIAVVRVHWPGGDVEEWRDLEPRRYWTLRRGTSPERTPA